MTNKVTIGLESVMSDEMGESSPLLISDLITKLTNIRDSAPQEFRSSVYVQFRGEGGYLHIAYERPKTDDEVRASEEAEAKRAGERKIETLKLAERLSSELGMKLVPKNDA
jgi:hypothetical protein